MAATDPSDRSQRPDGRRRRWDAHNRERRLQILDAALDVIEDHQPGSEIHAEQIARRARLSRTVLYRHFEDRAQLDRAVHRYVVGLLGEELLPAVKLEGSVREIIERVVSAYIAWAVEHPALHHLIEQDVPSSEGPSALQNALQNLAVQGLEVFTSGAEQFGVRLTPEEQAGLDPLVFGLVGAVFSVVRRWMERPDRTPDAPAMVGLTADLVWYYLAGFARGHDVVLDPDQRVEDLVLDAAPRR